MVQHADDPVRHMPVTATPPPPPSAPRTLDQAIGLNVVGQVLVLGLAFGTSILTARLLGPDGKGQLTTALLIAGLLSALLDFGLRQAFARVLASGQATWKEAATTHLVLVLALCVVAVPAALGLGIVLQPRWLPNLPVPFLVLALAGLPLTLVYGCFAAALAGLQRTPEVTWLQVVERSTLMLAALLLTGGWHWGVTGVLVGQLASTTLVLAVNLLLLWRQPAGRVRLRFDLVPAAVRFGWHCYASFLATNLYRVDMLLVFNLIGKAAAGIYAVGTTLAELLLQVPYSIALVLFPAVSGQPEGTEQRTIRLSRIALAVSLFCGGILCAVGYPVIAHMYGPAFTPAFLAMLLLLPGTWALGQQRLLAADLMARGYPQYAATAAWVTVVLMVAGDVLLIGRWQLPGASLASSVAYLIGDILMIRWCARLFGVPWTAFVAITREDLTYLATRLARLLAPRKTDAEKPSVV
jgi:O-antigen/teichoic acid export membrane protein